MNMQMRWTLVQNPAPGTQRFYTTDTDAPSQSEMFGDFHFPLNWKFSCPEKTYGHISCPGRTPSCLQRLNKNTPCGLVSLRTGQSRVGLEPAWQSKDPCGPSEYQLPQPWASTEAPEAYEHRLGLFSHLPQADTSLALGLRRKEASAVVFSSVAGTSPLGSTLEQPLNTHIGIFILPSIPSHCVLSIRDVGAQKSQSRLG